MYNMFNTHDNITLEITENDGMCGVNKCKGTLVMLLFNADLDVLMKILSFTCRACLLYHHRSYTLVVIRNLANVRALKVS